MSVRLTAILSCLWIALGVHAADSTQYQDRFTVFGTEDPIDISIVAPTELKRILKGALSLELRVVGNTDDPVQLKKSMRLVVRDLNVVAYDFPLAKIDLTTSKPSLELGDAGISIQKLGDELLTLEQVSETQFRRDIPVLLPVPGPRPDVKDLHAKGSLPTAHVFQEGLLNLFFKFEKPPTELVTEKTVKVNVLIKGRLKVKPVTAEKTEYSGYEVELSAQLSVTSANLQNHVATKELCLQPVFVRKDPSDTPAGGAGGATITGALPAASTQWGKHGVGNYIVTFSVKAPIFLDNPALKTDVDSAKVYGFPTRITRKCTSVFAVERLLGLGGGATPYPGTWKAYVVLGDNFAAAANGDQILAHELGHVMRLEHACINCVTTPLLSSSTGTMMCGGGQSLFRNSADNVKSATHPYMIPGAASLRASPADCTSSADCGPCTLGP